MAPVPPPTTSLRRTALLLAVVLGALVATAGVIAVVVVGGGIGAPAGTDSGGTDPDRPLAATTDAAPLRDGYRVWASNDDGVPVRWDPCRPIDLVVDDTGAPEGFRADLADAIAAIEGASGLELRIIGTTTERPGAGRAAHQPARYGDRWAPVLVAWADPHEQQLPLHEFDRGVAMPVDVGTAGDQTYVTGQVVLNRTRTDLRPGNQDRASSWGATILHELMHLVGLAHVDDPQEMMSTRPGSGPVELGPGDTAGLRALGTATGCRPPPPPGPVEMIERS
jgi:hypothetical protein